MPPFTGALPYFDSAHLPNPPPAYVAWLDVMGVGATMGRSLDITANFVMKLHAALLEALTQDHELYPLMDGAYIATATRAAMTSYLDVVLTRMADLFVSTPENHHRFLVKGALAFGPTVRGSTIPDAASQTLADNPEYRARLLLGQPMVQAYHSENLAPPFGIYVHESARTFSAAGERPFTQVWWNWGMQAPPPGLKTELMVCLGQYFDWCKERSTRIQYPSHRIDEHRRMAIEYFMAI